MKKTCAVCIQSMTECTWKQFHSLLFYHVSHLECAVCIQSRTRMHVGAVSQFTFLPRFTSGVRSLHTIHDQNARGSSFTVYYFTRFTSGVRSLHTIHDQNARGSSFTVYYFTTFHIWSAQSAYNP